MTICSSSMVRDRPGMPACSMNAAAACRACAWAASGRAGSSPPSPAPGAAVRSSGAFDLVGRQRADGDRGQLDDQGVPGRAGLRGPGPGGQDRPDVPGPPAAERDRPFQRRGQRRLAVRGAAARPARPGRRPAWCCPRPPTRSGTPRRPGRARGMSSPPRSWPAPRGAARAGGRRNAHRARRPRPARPGHGSATTSPVTGSATSSRPPDSVTATCWPISRVGTE